MDNPLQAFQDWLTYVNVQLLGLKPFRIDPVRTPLMVAAGGVFVWAMAFRDSGAVIARFGAWWRGRSSLRMTIIVAGLLVLGLAYLSLRQYYDFTAESYDLGIYSSVLWHTIHGNWFYDALRHEHFLGDHFGPILAAFAPLYWLEASPVWLLLLQAVALSLGAVAVGMLTARWTGNPLLVFVALLLYVSNPYLHTVAALDFHLVALAIPLFLWMLYCLDTEQYVAAFLLAGIALLVEEILAAGVASIGIYLVLFRPKDRRIGAVIVAAAIVWFLLVVVVLLPYYGNGALTHWHRFAHLGPDFKTTVHRLMANPLLIVYEGLIIQHKFLYVLSLFLAVGFLPLLAWKEAMLMVSPALMMLLSNDGGLYKMGFHYSAAVLPFVLYSAIRGLATIENLPSSSSLLRIRTERVAFCGLALLMVLNVYQIRDYRLKRTDPGHIVAIRTVLNVVPEHASVRGEVNLIARLSTRHQVAPIRDVIEDNFEWWPPEYFILDFRELESNPRRAAARRALMEYLLQDDRYRLLAGYDGVLAFKVSGQLAPLAQL